MSLMNNGNSGPPILLMGDRGSVQDAKPSPRKSMLSPRGFQNRLNSKQEVAPPFPPSILTNKLLTLDNLQEVNLQKILEKRSALHSHRVSDAYANDCQTIRDGTASPFSSLAHPTKETHKKMVKITHAPSQVVLPNIAGQKFNADLNPVTRKKPNSPQSVINQGGNDDDN